MHLFEMKTRGILLYINFLIYKIRYRKNIYFRGWAIVYASKGSNIVFAKRGVTNIFSHSLSNMIGINQRCILVAKNGGSISIGSHVCMSGCTIYSIDSIIIGDYTDIGAGCKIIDTDFHPLPMSQRCPIEQKDKIKHRSIFIGKGCFLGANSIILKGTKLGNNVVVGAGSVVSGEFPDNVIIGGNPAKIIKTNEI